MFFCARSWQTSQTWPIWRICYSPGGFIESEGGHRALRVYRGKGNGDRLPSLPSEGADSDFDAAYDGDQDDGGCDSSDVDSTLDSAVVTSSKALECFHRVRAVRWEAGFELLQNFLKLPVDLAKRPAAMAPSLVASCSDARARVAFAFHRPLSGAWS